MRLVWLALFMLALLPLGAARAQTQQTQTIQPNATASVVLPSGQGVTIQNMLAVPATAALNGFVLTVTISPTSGGQTTGASPIMPCERGFQPSVAFLCDYSVHPFPPSFLPIFDAYALTAMPGPTMTQPQTASTPGGGFLLPGCSVTFANGSQSLTVVHRSLAMIVGATPTTCGQPAGAGSPLVIYVSFDGATVLTSDEIGINSSSPGCASINGLQGAFHCAGTQGPLVLTETIPNPAANDCRPRTSLPAGWNLVSGSVAASITTNIGPKYTLQAGDANYEVVQPGSTLPAKGGYWVLVDQPWWVSMGCTSVPTEPLVQNVPLNLPAGQWVMVDNPFSGDSKAATVIGADVVYTYDPTTEYQQTNTLQPGRGAFAYSAAGATATIERGQPTSQGQ